MELSVVATAAREERPKPDLDAELVFGANSSAHVAGARLSSAMGGRPDDPGLGRGARRVHRDGCCS